MPTKTDPKPPVSVAAKQGCCGGAPEREPRTEAAMHAGHDCCEDAQPSPAAQSSCCCGTNSPSHVANATDPSIARK